MTTIHIDQRDPLVTREDWQILAWTLGASAVFLTAVCLVAAKPAATIARLDAMAATGVIALLLLMYSATLVVSVAWHKTRRRPGPVRKDAAAGARQGVRGNGEEYTREMPAAPAPAAAGAPPAPAAAAPVNAYGPSGVMPRAEHGTWTPPVAPDAPSVRAGRHGAPRDEDAEATVAFDAGFGADWADYEARLASREAAR